MHVLGNIIPDSASRCLQSLNQKLRSSNLEAELKREEKEVKETAQGAFSACITVMVTLLWYAVGGAYVAPPHHENMLKCWVMRSVTHKNLSQSINQSGALFTKAYTYANQRHTVHTIYTHSLTHTFTHKSSQEYRVISGGNCVSSDPSSLRHCYLTLCGQNSHRSLPQCGRFVFTREENLRLHKGATLLWRPASIVLS